MGKGSGRRPTQVDRETEQKNWERIFPPKQRTKYEPPPLKEETLPEPELDGAPLHYDCDCLSCRPWTD